MATAFEMSSGALPIGVVIPVLNCRPDLPAHLSGSADWLPSVEQVVVVDSFSSDGSLEYLRQELKLPRAEFHTHPPGLYDSWNFGIGRIQAKYLYVSTIGDLISLDGLRQFVACAEKFQADVVLSPPEMVAMDGSVIESIQWPIHEIVAATSRSEPLDLDSIQLFTLAIFYATCGGLKSMLGSSASSLYKTETFKARPFPADFGIIGDTAWGLRNTLDTRFAISPHVQ
jgi:hypothetical protein